MALLATRVSAALDTNRIEQITGLKGAWNVNEGVFKISQPRTDVVVKVDDWKMPPFMGLTSWAAFLAGKKAEAMVMGDLVLFEDEVNPVMSAVLDNGLVVTALHNHFFFAEPQVYFMHIGGEDTVEKLAGGVKAALAKVQEIRTAKATPAKSFGGGISENNITPGPLAATFTAPPQQRAGMVKFVFGRVARMECGCQVGAEMGLNTWASFGGRDDDAVVDGDFACQENELQPVLKSLRGAGINIVAIHHHMIHETPRYVFLHYWGRGKALDLAQAIRRARGEQTKVAAAKARAEGGFKTIPAADFEKRRAKGRAPVLDVRTAEEFRKGHVTGAINADIHSPEFAAKAAAFDKKKPILVNCHLGSRGDIAAAELARMGFKNVFNLEGGLDAWEKAGNHPEK